MAKRIGIDLGGTKIESILLDDEGQEMARRRRPTPKDDYRAIVQTIIEMVQELEQGFDCRASVGVGIPGAISPVTDLVKNANTVCLIGKPLHTDLGEGLGREVRLSNDANCFAVSEATDGAAAGAKLVFGVILGTGCGSGIAIKGEALGGHNAIAGEWGHNPLPWPSADELPGTQCFCGQRGCLETWISGTGFEDDYERATGTRLRGAEIVALSESGDEQAEAALQRYENRLARALAVIINILDPDVIVLGGGMSNVQRLYTNVPKIWTPYIFSGECSTEIRPPVHGDSSGVRGAAWLWPHE